ncbi:MAG: bifunctional [glutamine synthetase] adenylyltransferase/[glutamine synthetase]-adenylyl-L-tyrosine phosphorylase [Rhodospirillales bacterium]|nr:bifunctional [glutamine synthetase] adenylyltransferase/[glutamine synthetase]-adenylyl-L-tyrosine phosphorylase [Rhodospirillales bacterium]
MDDLEFLDSLGPVPLAADVNALKISLERLNDAIRGAPDTDLADRFQRLLAHSKAVRLIEAILANSPYLTWCATIDPGFFCDLLINGPDVTSESALNVLINKRKETLNESEIAKALRVAKRRMALTIAVADISETWTLEKITGTLSQFASLSLSVAASHLLRETAKNGGFSLSDMENPELESGLVILGMGKLGARELNYSSDIDLIVLFDPEVIQTTDPDRLQTLFVRLTRQLVKLMEERTGDGYVFRTDLRLRPDPGATPIALSTYAAETYYESLGQNWERAAMIKARPVAGDIQAGERFLKWLRPFIWRKSLDYAAIQDIHSIKRQINAHKGGNRMDVPGHNIKLGRGGIREIEFFAQTQQLIWGGREPNLRPAVTLDALNALTEFGLCEPETCTQLSTSYRFLRRLEHRLQMINDEQTQTLPEDSEKLHQLALFTGYPDTAAFVQDVETHIKAVHAAYANLFDDAPSLGTAQTSGGNLVFTGGDPDPETLQTIADMGFTPPETIDAAIRGWHHGRYRATHSTRAREILTELMPILLAALATMTNPTAAFLRFDEFLRGLPAGIQLFSMFKAQPAILSLVAEIMGKAPRLARRLAGRPSLLDSVLAPDFFDPPPTLSELDADLADQLATVEYLEDALNSCRRWANDHRFQIGVQQLQGLIDPRSASASLSDIAQTALKYLYPPVAADFAKNHGQVAGARMAVLALGKLGSREMTASSDLDLVFIYDVTDETGQSDGAKPLYVTQYFARLGQRYINAITALTQEGSLYEVDMRLRPSGNSGPIATTLNAFQKYHATSAWTWEHMALTRARVVVADDSFADIVNDAVRQALTAPRDPDKLRTDVASMRVRLAKEKPGDGLWSLKQMRGGMVDIEFITQYLLLKHGHDHPEILHSNTLTSLQNLCDAQLLDSADGHVLMATLRLWQGLQGMLSLTIEEEMTKAREADMSTALKADLVAIAGEPDFPQLEARVKDDAAQVFAIFEKIVGSA